MAKALEINRLKKRPEYLKVGASGIKKAMPGLVVQFLPPLGGGTGIRVGLTVSARVGGAVERNRIKRRLRAVIAEVLPDGGLAGGAYVVIGRRPALTRDYQKLVEDLKTALSALHKEADKKTGS